jgi:hypothetical protein
LEALGVPKLLARAGAADGDIVHVGEDSRSSTIRTCDVRVVAKIRHVVTDDELGVIDEDVIDSICEQLVRLRMLGHEVVLVSSGLRSPPASLRSV